MDIRTYQLCLVAQEFVSTHGRFYAAAFLAENGIRIEIAKWVLTSPSSVLASEHSDIVRICSAAGNGDIWRSKIT